MNKLLLISLGAVFGLSTGWRLVKRPPPPKVDGRAAYRSSDDRAPVTGSQTDVGLRNVNADTAVSRAGPTKAYQSSGPVADLRLYKEDEWIQMPSKALELSEIGDLTSMLIKPHSQGTERRLLAELLRVSPAEIENLFNAIENCNQLWAEKASAAIRVVSPGVLQVDLDEATRTNLNAQLTQQAREILPAEAAYVFEAVSFKLRERLYGAGPLSLTYDLEKADWNISYADGTGKAFTTDSLDQRAPLRKVIQKAWPDALINR